METTAPPIRRICLETSQEFWAPAHSKALFCSKEARAAYQARQAANKAA